MAKFDIKYLADTFTALFNLGLLSIGAIKDILNTAKPGLTDAQIQQILLDIRIQALQLEKQALADAGEPVQLSLPLE